ncbi:MAG TPA: DUF1549 and DUF1553 domain-containing protein [Chthonomonadaceae bacterium]|nr:DUF1549 and DUF1553 domain-containing protein [Chthonomonadaceae bacterium]
MVIGVMLLCGLAGADPPQKPVPTGQTRSAQPTWWAFKPPVKPAVPHASTTWGHNPIDAFVLVKLRESGLTPSKPAPRNVLIRRAYMDLIGLPPTPEEVQAFEADTAPNAWEKVVDRLLASPRYGERWGRHWLDVIRYADSGGFEGDKDRPLAWRYRDYVIAAFNQDKPYDRFVREQIAGDEITPASNEGIIATGYLACGPQDIVMQNAKNRSDELDDLVTTTGTAFLGLTMGCARCHDHKYDPIKQADYYRFSAIFAPSERREIEIPTPEERQAAEAKNVDIEKQLAPLRQKLEALKQQGLKAVQAKGQAKPNDEQIVAALPEAAYKEWDATQKAIQALEAQRPSLPRAMAVTDRGRDFPAAHLLIRGDAYHEGEVVQPGFICSLPGGSADIPPTAAKAQTTGRRTALADWLTSPDNPLLARVFMNRVWQHHFGRGIVNTPSNFGLSGDPPTHPELLDWLAVTFRENGWHLKPIHRMILLSATWQQSSTIRPEAEKADPQDRLLWRMPTRRLEGEVIRDSILSVAGTLNLQMGGPPVYPPVDPSLRADTFQGPNWQDGEDGPSTWRRSVYVKVKRSLLLPELEVFDCPEITVAVAQRNITTTPTQALTLLNDPLVLRQSALFAQRIQKEVGKDPGKQIERAYRLCFGRAPTPRERALSLDFLTKRGPSGLADFCHSLLNLNEFVYVP